MKFVSRRKEFRLIIRPTEVVLDESRRPRVHYGEKVEFHQGVYHTEDKSLINYLVHHRLYGRDFTSEIGNDPIEIEKYTNVFDDGAELTGPKVVAGYPERNRPKGVEMVSGAISTQNNPVKPETKNPQRLEVPGQAKEVEKSSFVTKEEMSDMMDSKFDAFMDKIGSLVIQPIKKIKAFHCPICGLPFPSGVAVGTHKKEAHPQ